jgi:hypothetical protein
MANAAITPRLSETAFKPAILPGVNLIGMYFSHSEILGTHDAQETDAAGKRKELEGSSLIRRVARTISDWIWGCQSMITDNQ